MLTAQRILLNAFVYKPLHPARHFFVCKILSLLNADYERDKCTVCVCM